MTFASVRMVLGVVFVAFVLAMLLSDFTAFALGEVKIESVIGTLTTLAVVALLVERAVQVLKVVHLDERIDRKVADAVNKEQADVAKIVRSTVNPQDADQRQLLQEHEHQTGVHTTIAALILSLIVALVGLRLLATFIPADAMAACIVNGASSSADVIDALKAALAAATMPEATQTRLVEILTGFCEIEAWQRRLFVGTDVVVTGAIIAGGSNLIHDMIKRIQASFAPQNQAD